MMPDHTHHFDPISGWCNCGYRDDGRLISKTGEVFRPGPNYTLQQLEQFRQKAKAS